ncbi:uL30 family ribosomal protein [Candidatus Pacearchaeota archaeon]|nr:uL30 family ribosomal protein [Candidatus Pacearchaeota archaeon]
MIAVIRIHGMVDMNERLENTLSRMRLRRKYACTLIPENKVTLGMLKKVRSFVAYGDINDETLVELIAKRGKLLDKTKKIDAKKIAELIQKNENFEDTGIKPFFRLHPPRKGINSKQHFPKGVLGNHREKINDLLRRML